MENNPSIIGTTLSHLPPGVTEHLGYYVYIYLDPRTLQPFYVGKGKGERILAHLNDDLESEKVRIIADLRSNGMSPQLEVLAHGLRDEETAFRVEAAAIDLLGLDNLSNKVRGWKSLQTGRMTLDELIGYYAAEPVEITHPALLIRVNQLYRHNLPADELYEITRGIWKLGERRMGVNYAMAVFEGGLFVRFTRLLNGTRHSLPIIQFVSLETGMVMAGGSLSARSLLMKFVVATDYDLLKSIFAKGTKVQQFMSIVNSIYLLDNSRNS